MDRNEVKKLLYKEKPTATLVKIKDGFFVYTAAIKSNRQTVDFKVPVDETVNTEGETIFGDTEPAQLLIRWLV